MDTRFKLSKELAATFTFFLASGFMFVDAMFAVILGGVDVTLTGGIGDAIKLIVFPFVAFIMVLNFIRKSRKEPKAPHVYDDIPIVPEEPEKEPMAEPEEPEPKVEPEEVMMAEEEPTDTEEVEEEEIPVAEEEPTSEEDSV